MPDITRSFAAIRRPVECMSRDWVFQALRGIHADLNPSVETHLIYLPLSSCPGIELYLKDESSHPTGSLKHQIARSLFLYGLCDDWIGPTTMLVEASSGSTAVPVADFARLLGLCFFAVVPRSTAAAKLEAIRFHFGVIHKIDVRRTIFDEVRRLFSESGGHCIDQSACAECVTDCRGSDKIAESVFARLAGELHPGPDRGVCGAGTGSTSATIGRFIRYKRYAKRLWVADPCHLIFHRAFDGPAMTVLPDGCASLIKGAGRPRIEPSVVLTAIDRMAVVDDAESMGAMRAVSNALRRRVGGPTGTRIWACPQIAGKMADRGTQGSIFTSSFDSGCRYIGTYYDDDWPSARRIDWRAAQRQAQPQIVGRCASRPARAPDSRRA